MSWGAQTLLTVLVFGLCLTSLYCLHLLRAHGRLLRQQTTDRQTLDRLTTELLDNHRREQRRMSKELHDGVSQNLAGISLLVESFAPQLQSVSADAAKKAQRLLVLLEGTRQMAEDRAIAPRLGSLSEEAGDLAKILGKLAENLQTFFGLECSISGTCPRLDPLTAGHLYRLAEEVAYNAIRHAAPEHVLFVLSHEANEACLLMEDDGHGIRGTPDPKGRGLHLMSLRAKKIGGSLQMGPREPKGTRVTCRWPVDWKDSP